MSGNEPIDPAVDNTSLVKEDSSLEPRRENSALNPTKKRSALYRRNVSSLLRLRQTSGLKIEVGGEGEEASKSGSVSPSPSRPQSPVASNAPAVDVPRSPTGTVRRRNSSIIPRKKPSAVKAPSGEPVPAKPEEKGAAPPTRERPNWHTMTAEEFYAAVKSHEGGLTQEEAERRLVEVGKNELAPPEQTPLIVRFGQNLFSPFSLMLQLAGVLSFIIVGINSSNGLDVQTLALAIVLFSVAILTSAFQTSQEAAADNLVAALHELTAEFAWVMRDGVLKKLEARDIVPGDQLRVLSGEKVPADVRIMTASDLKVNNAPLTGETMDIKLGPVAAHHDIFEAKNIAWSGCNFTSGTGLAVVFDTGERTYFGDIAKATTTAEKPDTLMRREVRRLVIIMACIGTVMGFAFFGASLGTGQPWQNAVIILIGLFVANIPEGLLPQITIALTITAKRMQERKVVVSNLEIIETLGAVSVICSDKTGTLTTNKMSVSHVVYHGKIHVTPTTAMQPDDKFDLVDLNCSTVKSLFQVGALCSDAAFISKEGTDPAGWLIKGDATESGLMRYIQPNLDVEEARKENTRLAYVPFHSERKWMASVNAVKNTPTVLFKGAAERVLTRCVSVIFDGDGTEVPLTEELIEEYQRIISSMAKRGERVLGFARLPLRYPVDYEWNADGEDSNFELDDLILIGFVSLADPPRLSVKPAVQACHTAGIKVIMVTGDHPETATAISKSLGIITLPLLSDAPDDANPDEFAAVVTGEDIQSMSEHDWDRVLACKEQIFARTQPEQKQALVYNLQRHGYIVAMTGDGVNDAPALKAAHVGIAMGSGTSVAKEAAQIVVTDDDFGSIVVGIKEGRQIFENMKKAVVYIITHLMPEAVPFLLVFIIGIPLGIESIVIMLVDLGTDMLPGISLAYEEAEDRIMTLPPRKSTDHLISAKMILFGYGFCGLLESFFAMWAYFWTFYDFGFTFNSIRGRPTSYRSAYKDLDSDDQRSFRELCQSNTKYIREHGGNSTWVCNTHQGMTMFMGDYSEIVSNAQAAFFIIFASMQLANILCRRQQTMSAFDPRQTPNIQCFGSILFSIGFMCFFVYIPKVNNAFFLAGVSSSNACAALWGIPVLFLIEETRKFFCRNWPDGLMAKLTVY